MRRVGIDCGRSEGASRQHALRIGLIGIALLGWQMTFGQSGAVNAGKIEGTVTFVGEIPKSTVVDDAGVRHDLVEVDAKTRGLRNVVVYLTRADGAKLLRQHGPPTTNSSKDLLMDQLDYAFRPRVLAVEQGKAVTFTNSDPANHNVRTTALNKTNEFNVFTGVDGKYEHRFGLEPQYRPVRLGCDIHAWMRGWIYVFDHPYFEVTDEEGRFRIAGVPPGEYVLHVVQPDIAHREERRVSVGTNGTSKVEIVIRR